MQLASTDAQNVIPVTSTDSIRTLTCYLKEHYLPALAEAGNHVFFSIPRSDNEEYRLTIDYSTMTREEGYERVIFGELHGISIGDFTSYLALTWLKEKYAHRENAYQQARSYLTEHQAITPNAFFHLHMRPLKLEPVCSREAILTFTIGTVAFYEDEDMTPDTG